MADPRDDALSDLLREIPRLADPDAHRAADRLFTPRVAAGDTEGAERVIQRVAPFLGIAGRDRWALRLLSDADRSALERAVFAQSLMEAAGTRLRLSPLRLALRGSIASDVEWMRTRVGYWTARNGREAQLPEDPLAAMAYLWRRQIQTGEDAGALAVQPAEFAALMEAMSSSPSWRTPRALLGPIQPGGYRPVRLLARLDVNTDEGPRRLQATTELDPIATMEPELTTGLTETVLRRITQIGIDRSDYIYITEDDGAPIGPDAPDASERERVHINAIAGRTRCRHPRGEWVGCGDFVALSCPDCARPHMGRFPRHRLPEGHGRLAYLVKAEDLTARTTYIARRRAEAILATGADPAYTWEELRAEPWASMTPGDYAIGDGASSARRPRSLHEALWGRA